MGHYHPNSLKPCECDDCWRYGLSSSGWSDEEIDRLLAAMHSGVLPREAVAQAVLERRSKQFAA